MRKILSFSVLVMSLAFATPAPAQDAKPAMTIYKDPQCACCESYAAYMTKNGYAVTVKPTHDLVMMSRSAGIPEAFQGCHLGMVDGYIVSGHVPVNTVNRLLSERPPIPGITLPGMPAGSPGMGGAKEAPFKVYEIGGGPAARVYAVE